MKRMIASVSVLFFPLCALAADPPKSGEMTDPVEILKKADAATKQNKAVSYNAAFKGIGANEAQAPNLSGSVFLSGWNNGAPAKYRVDAKVQKPGASETRELIAAFDSDKYVFIDKKTKKVHEDIDSAVMGSNGRDIRGLWMLELIHPDAFADEIKGEKHELKESVKIGTEDCYQVFVKYAQQPQEANWFFSKKDLLPRKVERIFTTPTGEKRGVELTITDLNTAPKLEPDPFKPAVPEGFTKTDDFAP